MVARSLGSVAVLLVLAACGGGGGSGGGGSGMASSPSGLTIPTSGNGNGDSLIARSGTINEVTITRQASGTNSSVSSGPTSSVSFTGSPEAWSAVMQKLGDLGIFETTDGTSAVVTGGNGSSSAASIKSYEHTTYGVWMETSASGVLTGSSEQVTGAGGFVIGDATPVADMPRAGSASYRGQAVAVELRDGRAPRTLSGTSTANVDFGTGRVNASATLEDAVSRSPFGTVSMNGLAISGNKFSGTATATTGHTGSVEGSFAGPRAAEIGGAFELAGPSAVYGSFAGSSR